MSSGGFFGLHFLHRSNNEARKAAVDLAAVDIELNSKVFIAVANGFTLWCLRLYKLHSFETCARELTGTLATPLPGSYIY